MADRRTRVPVIVRVRHWLGVVAMSAVSCSAGKSAPTAREAVKDSSGTTAASGRTEGDAFPITYADVRVTASKVPARFGAPLPTSLAEFENVESYPPAGQIRAGICEGNVDWLAKYLTALGAAHAAGKLDQQLQKRFGELGGRCFGGSGACGWLAETTLRDHPREVEAVLYRAMEYCDVRYRPAIERAETPDDAVLNWYSHYRSGRRLPELTERVRRAARNELATRRGREVRVLIVPALLSFDDPALVDFVKEAGRKLDPDSRAQLSLSLAYRTEPRAKELFLNACKSAHTADDPICKRDDSRATTQAPTLLETALDYHFSSNEWLASNPQRRAELVQTLAECVEKPTEEQNPLRARCLSTLAAIDWSRARALAPGTPPDSPWDLEQLAALRHFASPADMKNGLIARGLMSGDDADIRTERASPPTTVAEVLQAHGRLHDFDIETDQFPNEHDVLLRAAAKLARPALSDVFFEEVPPRHRREPVADFPGAERLVVEPSSSYTLYAYSRGKRYETSADATAGDWYDLHAVLGLLNVVLRDRASPTRFIVLDRGGQEAGFVAGKPTALAWLTDNDLVRGVTGPDSIE